MELSLKWESPTIILGRNRPKVRKIALKELKWRVFLWGKEFIVWFARCSLQFAYSLHFAFLLTNGRWLGRWRSGAKHSMRASTRARVTCAPSLGISIFCFHNLHREPIFPRESRPRELSSAEDFFPRKNESLFPFFISKAKHCS